MSWVKSMQRLVPAALAAYIARSALRSRSGPAAVVAIADRRAQVQALAFEHHGGGQHGEDPVHEGVQVGHFDREDRELVAAQARDGVARAQRVAQPLAGDLQQPVTGGVAERVVDPLEVVEVEERDHRGLPPASVSAMRRSNSGRFGRPVSESSNASRRSWASRERRRPARSSRREQRGQADDEQRHDGDGADPRETIAAGGDGAVALGGHAQAPAQLVAGGIDDSVDRRARSKSRARSSANSSS